MTPGAATLTIFGHLAKPPLSPTAVVGLPVNAFGPLSIGLATRDG